MRNLRTLTQGVRGSSPAEVLELIGLRMSRGRIACGTLVVPRSLWHPLDPLTILRFDTRIVSLSDGVMRNPSERGLLGGMPSKGIETQRGMN